MASGLIGAIAEVAGAPPGYGEIDFRTGEMLEPTINDYAMGASAEQAEDERLAKMARAWAYYHGQQKRPLEVSGEGFDDNVLVNKSRTVVDKGVAFLFGKPFRVFDGTEDSDATGDADAAPAEDGAETRAPDEDDVGSPVTDAIEQLLRANKGMLLWQLLAMNGGICGHAWLKLQPRKAMPPRLVVLDPQTVSVKTDDDDCEVVLEYTITWSGISSATDKPYTRRQRIIDQSAAGDGSGPWLVVDERSDGDGPFVRIQEPVAWDYSWPPIIGCQNLPCPNEFYGVSDIEEDLLDLNDAVNYGASNTQRIIRFHGHPHMWATGMQGMTIDLSPDVVIGLPQDATLDQLEMQGDLSAAQAFGDRLADAIHEQARVPQITTGKLDNIGVLSGLALKILYAPIVEKTEQKQLLYGWLLTEAVKRSLELMSMGDAESFELELEWPEIVPSDALEERNVAVIDNELGVSKATLMTRLGYDAESEQAKSADEAATAISAQQQAFSQGAGAGNPYPPPGAPDDDVDGAA